MIGHVLDNQRCALWAEPGTGKTGAVYAALDALQLAGSRFWPLLVLAPPQVAIDIWPNETRKWDFMRGYRVSSLASETPSPKQRRAALAVDADIYTINYENVQWLMQHLGEAWPFGAVVADEATRLGGFRLRHGTKRSAALSKIAHKAGRWINLAGAPAANSLVTLWGQTWFLDYGARLGHTFTAFFERWFTRDPYTFAETALPFAREQIEERLRDICLTIRARGYFDLHEPIVQRLEVDLPPAARRHYDEVADDFYTALDAGEVTAQNGAARSAKMLQIASGCVYDDDRVVRVVHDAKLDRLESLLEELGGAPLFVVAWWRGDQKRILDRFPFARKLDTTAARAEWNAGKIRLGVGNQASLGHGVELQHGGHRIAFYSDWWDLELRLQVLERLGPMRQYQAGYDRPVYVYELIARDTVDELVSVRHAQKLEVMDLLMNATRRKHAVH